MVEVHAVSCPAELGDARRRRGLGGPADGVDELDDRRTASVRLDQFDGRIDYTIAKTAPDVSYARWTAADALWFDEPHEVTLLHADGSPVTHAARLAGHTLIWQDGATTLRLEGDLSLAGPSRSRSPRAGTTGNLG